MTNKEQELILEIEEELSEIGLEDDDIIECPGEIELEPQCPRCGRMCRYCEGEEIEEEPEIIEDYDK